MDFPEAIEKNSARHPKNILQVGLTLVALGILAYVLIMAEPFGTVPLTSEVDNVPLPFAVHTTPSLRGAITDGGSKNGMPVKIMTFDAGEVSEVIPKNALTIALVPNAQDIAHGATLQNALASGKRVYGYKYSSYSGQAERDADARAQTGVPMSFSELFPGQFFASKESRQDGNFISNFEVQKDIVFHPLKNVTLERHSRYIFITSDDGTSFSVRGDLLCGNGVLNGTEACDDFGNTSGDGCSSQCTVESGYTCTGAPSVCTVGVCGDSITKSPEECDDGNLVDTDECTNACSYPSLGGACLLSGLNAYWKFDEAIGTRFAAAGTLHLQELYGPTPSAPGRILSAASASGSETAMFLLQHEGAALTNADRNFTVAQWVKLPAERNGSAMTIYARDNSQVFWATGYTTYGSLPGFFFRVGDAVAHAHTFGEPVLDEWALLVGSYNATTKQVSVSVNGGPRDSVTLTGSPVLHGDPTTSELVLTNGLQDDLFDETGVWNRVLSEQEIEDLYNSGNGKRYADFGTCAAPPVCGNALQEYREQCDDGDTDSGDGCSSMCVLEPGYTCTGTSCQKVDPLCGNGVIDGREECDVGATPAPGCDNLCRVKTGFSCTGTPSVCVPDLLSLAGWYRTNGLFGNIADPPIAGERYDHAENVSIVKIDDDRALAVWSHGLFHFNDSGVSRRAIKASIFDGTTWSAPHTIEPMTDIEPAYCRTCTNPVATSDNQGNIHIFWESVDAPIVDGGARLNTYARYVSTFDGTNFSQKQKLTLAPYYIAGDLAAAFNESGEGIVAWSEWGSSHNNSNTVFAVRYSPMTGWTPTETVSTFFQSDELLLSGGDHLSFRPGVGIDSSGEATVLYRSLVYITQIHGSVSIYRADLLSRTFSEQAWSPASVVVSEPISWSGPSNSYPGMTYTRSVNKFAFSMRPDGSALLAYGLTVPSTQQGSMNFPKERVYTKEFKNGAWATAFNQQPDTESYRGIQPLIAVNPLSEGGVVAWYENYGNSSGMYNSKLLKNGTWSHPLSTGVPVESMPLFVHWSEERGRYLVAMTHKLFANSSPQGFTQDRGISLTEIVPATNTLLRPYAFLVPHTSDVQTAGVAELAETFVTVWLQPEQRSFLDDPRYYTHQHILRHAVFQK